MVYLASNGYRCVAHDRRGHGRSSQPWNGNNMDTYADDLAVFAGAVRTRWRRRSATARGSKL
jgi:non-heme chloroperoxidase